MQSTRQSLVPPFRLLIAEDEPGWAKSMRRAIIDACEECEISLPDVDVVEDMETARHHLSVHPYHLISLDIRLPAGKTDSAVEVGVGIKLAEEALGPIASLPKTLLFTATLNQEQIKGSPGEETAVLDRLPTIDKYAKASGGDVSTTAHFETLSQGQWAKRVLDYLTHDELYLPEAWKGKKRETVVGAWLTGAIVALPPLLARHAQEMHNHWPGAGRKVDARVVDAALKFMETTLRLALAQTAVLLSQLDAGFSPELPGDDSQLAAINTLRRWLQTYGSQLAPWSWRNYLTGDAMEAFDAASHYRNQVQRSLRTTFPDEDWKHLLPNLRQTMDVASYWAKHPLCAELTYGHDGWSGELLAGTAFPRPRRFLPGKDFPGQAVKGVWQTTIYEHEKAPGWAETAVCWDNWLADGNDERAYWLASHRTRAGQIVLLDLDGGGVGLKPDRR